MIGAQQAVLSGFPGPTDDCGSMAISIRRYFEINFVNKVTST